MGKEAKIEILPCQPGDVDRTCADISKARELLGYNPKVPFEEGIRRTAEWFREATEEGLFDDEDTTAVGATERDRSCSLLTVVSEDSSTDTGRTSPPASSTAASSNNGEGGRVQELVITPSRVKRSSTSSYNHKRHLFIHKISSDLELSSYVQKAPVQVKSRVTRIL